MSEPPEVRFVSVFAERPRHPRDAAAVVVGNADAAAMRTLAAELGCPVTVQVWPRGHVAYGVRFFYPRMESAMCVVGLIAAAHLVMASGERRIRTFTTAGSAIIVDRESEGRIMIALPTPVPGDVVADRSSVARALGLSADELGEGPIQIIAAGKPKLLVPVTLAAALAGVQPAMDDVRRLCEPLGAQGAFLFATSGDRYEARHFNPFALDREDPICGVGVAALGAYLALHDMDRRTQVTVGMGASTGMPGMIHLDVTGTGPRIGGFARTIKAPPQAGSEATPRSERP